MGSLGGYCVRVRGGDNGKCDRVMHLWRCDFVVNLASVITGRSSRVLYLSVERTTLTQAWLFRSQSVVILVVGIPWIIVNHGERFSSTETRAYPCAELSW